MIEQLSSYQWIPIRWIEKTLIARVLLPLPIHKSFDFLVPQKLSDDIAVGKRVSVRFRDKKLWGIVAALAEKSNHPGPLEEIVEISRGPAFSSEALGFCSRIAEQYLGPVGLVANRILPTRISKREERFLSIPHDIQRMLPSLETLSKRAPRQADLLRYILAHGSCQEKTLRQELGSIHGAVNRLLQKGLLSKSSTLHEVAPNSQGEETLNKASLRKYKQLHAKRVLFFSASRWPDYVRWIERELLTSRDILILAPEMFLAQQLHSYLQEHLGIEIGLFHSGIADGQRGRVWERVRSEELRFVVGTRSALFLPFANLGLIIVDEEQEASYKQQEMLPHYHARLVAVEKGKNSQTIFGSSAPSLETFHAVTRGQFGLIRPNNSDGQINVRIVDMSKEHGVLSNPLAQAIEQAISLGKGSLLGVNRRGYFQAVLCKKCGHPLRCEHCGVALTYHVKRAQFVCHSCGRSFESMVCSDCGSRALRFVGVGSERLENEVTNLFPQASISRFDRDTLHPREYADAIQEIAGGKIDILVGTPVIAKGPVIPSLGLVGAIGVDRLLAFPDFRAAERTYQYLSNLIGRMESGTAIIQTHYPDHYAVVAAARRDYDYFYESEIADRESLFYPPFSHLARVILHTSASEALIEVMHSFEVEALGPAPFPGRGGKTHFLIKGKEARTVRSACLAARKAIPSLEIDLDPA